MLRRGIGAQPWRAYVMRATRQSDMSARAAGEVESKRECGARGAAGNSPASLQKNCPHVKEQPRRSLWRQARRAERMWVRLFPGVALRPPRSSTVTGADFPALFPVFVFVDCRDTRAFICALTLWYRRKRLFAARLSCNRICSEDRAILCKSLILLTWTVLYLLHMAGYVTGCFFVVTTLMTLRMASDAVSFIDCGQNLTLRCENAAHSA